ncbi:MAG TPA: sigma-70 family RNA polymerase sigma factor [Pyrinomonadaceae bacterium]|jgi:RNA polymerase sigma-70 factor, ECF subfamily|nr:sigma-70 family RNA polymerase sigma factor [Pyrinomonadaceae bacterium]
MIQASREEVTGLLRAWSDGDQAALEKLIPLVYAELHRLAKRYMGHEHAGHSLQTSALVNEAYLRLVDAHGVRWQNRTHFFAVSAQIMRRILVDFARARQKLKRGGGLRQVTLDEGLVVSPESGADLLALDEALEKLTILDTRQSKVVELRYFGGLNEEEVAAALNVSPRTVRHDWSLARAWLYRELSPGDADDA